MMGGLPAAPALMGAAGPMAGMGLAGMQFGGSGRAAYPPQMALGGGAGGAMGPMAFLPPALGYGLGYPAQAAMGLPGQGGYMDFAGSGGGGAGFAGQGMGAVPMRGGAGIYPIPNGEALTSRMMLASPCCL